MPQYWPFAGLIRHGSIKDRLIVSLDPGTRREALRMVERIGKNVGMYRIGKHLFLSAGPEFVRELRRHGVEVFLDLKFHDAPQAVCKTAVEATRLGAKMFDVHSYTSFDLMERVRAEVGRVCRSEGLRRPHILAVAMMTCLKPGERDGIGGEDHVVKLARLASHAALDGVLTSPQEAASVRSACGRRFIIATTGMKLENTDRRARSVSIGEAVRSGADYLVVGSPVWNAQEPERAVREIIEEMERGLRMNPRGALELLTPRTN